ncbi:MAG: hypothetical protein LBB95_01390 [Mycoplasmataceae bacterium]|nr:hypothetical protein [Mycoplasmataceae bacterium]
MSRNNEFNVEEIKGIIDEKINLKVIEESDGNFLKDILDKNPEYAMKIYTWATLCNKTGLMFQPILPKDSNEIKYLKKDNELSFSQGGLS